MWISFISVSVTMANKLIQSVVQRRRNNSLFIFELID